MEDYLLGEAHAELFARHADLVSIVERSINEVFKLVNGVVERGDILVLFALLLHYVVVLHNAPDEERDGEHKKQREENADNSHGQRFFI